MQCLGENADFICGHMMQYKCSPPRVKWLSNLYDLVLMCECGNRKLRDSGALTLLCLLNL